MQPALRAVSLFALWPHYTPTAGKVNSSIAQKSVADFMQIDERLFIIYIVYNSCTTIMPLRGAQSHFKRFLGQDVILYARSFYSVIHFLYSFNIHCFNGK